MKKLLLLTLFALITTFNLHAWTQLGPSGLNGTVRALTYYNGEIIAGGDFTIPNHVARYNGSSWVDMGSGLGSGSADKVYALTVYQGKLYAGGVFSTSGGTSLTNVAVFQNNAWSPVGTQLAGEVRCLFNDGSFLWAGGSFSGKIATLNVASSSWTIRTSATSGVVNDIRLFNGSYYMALSNNFQSTLGRMDGSSLTYIAGAPTGNAYALANFNGKLYMGGQLTYNSNYGVHAYNGTTYTALPNPLSPNCTVWDLYSDGTALYGGGNFTTNSQYPVALNGFFKYNTNYRLASVDGGFSGGDVYCIASTGSYFVCGGTFTTTGSSTSALRVARSTNLTIGIDEPENVVIDHIIYPNPVIQSATIRFTSREYLRNAYLRIMDQQGRTVAELPSDNSSNDLVSEFYINREGLAAGIYYYFLESDNSRPAGGKFIVQ